MNRLIKRVTVPSLTLIASALALTMPAHANETDVEVRGVMVLAADNSNASESSTPTSNMGHPTMPSVVDNPRPGATATKSGEVNASKLITSYQQLKSSNTLRGGEILDKTVVSTNGDELGEVKEIAISPEGNISNVVLSVGGFMGLGDRLVVLPWEALEISPATDKIRTTITKTDIAQAPLFDALSDRGLQLEMKEPTSSTNVAK